jgi:hypothetical protein
MCAGPQAARVLLRSGGRVVASCPVQKRHPFSDHLRVTAGVGRAFESSRCIWSVRGALVSVPRSGDRFTLDAARVAPPLLAGRSLSNMFFEGLAVGQGLFRPAYHTDILRLDLSRGSNLSDSLRVPSYILPRSLLCECYCLFLFHAPFSGICKLLMEAGA